MRVYVCVCVCVCVQEYEEDKKKAESSSTPSEIVSLSDCLQLFTEPETLSQEEAWFVERVCFLCLGENVCVCVWVCLCEREKCLSVFLFVHERERESGVFVRVCLVHD